MILAWYWSAVAPPTVHRCLFLSVCFSTFVFVIFYLSIERKTGGVGGGGRFFTLVADVELSFQGLFIRLFQGLNLSRRAQWGYPTALRASERVNPFSCSLQGSPWVSASDAAPHTTICIHPTQGGIFGFTSLGIKREMFSVSLSFPFFLFPFMKLQFVAKLCALSFLLKLISLYLPRVCWETKTRCLKPDWVSCHSSGRSNSGWVFVSLLLKCVNVVFITTTTTNDGNCNIWKQNQLIGKNTCCFLEAVFILPEWSLKSGCLSSCHTSRWPMKVSDVIYEEGGKNVIILILIMQNRTQCLLKCYRNSACLLFDFQLFCSSLALW